MNLATRRALLAFLLMLGSAGLAQWLSPTVRMSEARSPRVELASAIPLNFGDWHVDVDANHAVVNPQQEEVIRKLYSQALSRTYVDAQGRRVMLAVAYGNDQRRGLSVHFPEICYPAQGFLLLSSQEGTLQTSYGVIPIRRLETRLGSARPEPVTYWTTVGNEATLGGFRKRLIELDYGLHGIIPDGLLFRVSSIGADSPVEFAVQERFVRDLIPYLSPASRALLAGLPESNG